MQEQKIPQGYKKTEIGIIPEDWEVKKLGEIAECLDDHRIPLNESQRRKMRGIIPYCGANGVLDYVNDYTIDDDIILLAEDGGHFDEFKEKPIAYRMKGKCWVNNHAHIIKAKVGYSQDFLFYSLVHKDIRKYIGGGTRSKLNKNEMYKIEIFIPPRLSDQQAIARVLSDVDRLIESLDKLIEKEKMIKKGAMQELLTGRKRLPGFIKKAGYKKAEIGIIPEDWEVKKLEEIAECLDDHRIPLNEEQRRKMRGIIPYCGANGVLDYVNDYTIDDDIILLAEDGGHFDEFKEKPIAYRMKGKCWVNNHAHIIKARVGYSQDFLFYSLVHKDIRKYIGGGTRSKLNKNEMYKIEISLPPSLEEQQAIAQILSDMDAEIEALEKKKAKYEKIKKGLMEQLLTGKIRLKNNINEVLK